jgi:hypothetical protein
VFFDTRDRTIDLGEESPRRKCLIGAVVAVGSFSASSPHFFLNLLTIFSCSISLVRFTSFSVCVWYLACPPLFSLVCGRCTIGVEHVITVHGNW